MFRRLMASVLIVSLIAPFPAHAGMVATQDMLDRERIMNVVDRAEVQAQLQAYGVSPIEVKARVAALTDEEAAGLAAKIDSLPAGGIGIIGAILVVFLVLLLTDILGLTKIFPFTRPIR
jgi:uncharacterized protein DUF6627